MRTVGCCSRITAIIYYYSCGKYFEPTQQTNPAENPQTIFPYIANSYDSSDDCESSLSDHQSDSDKKDLRRKKSIKKFIYLLHELSDFIVRI
jgi:hypothetical protein